MRRYVKPIMLILLSVFLLPIAVRALVYFTVDERPPPLARRRLVERRHAAARRGRPRRAPLVMAGRTGSWKGIFAVHSWIVVKPAAPIATPATTSSAWAIRSTSTAGRRTGAGSATRRK